MESNLTIEESAANRLHGEYIQRLETAVALFDGRPFLLVNAPGERPSVSMYDAVMAAVDRLWRQREKLLKAKEEVQSHYWAVLGTQEQIEKFTGRANTASDVKVRTDSMTSVFKAAIRDARL
jgi:hypothetical protein